MKNIFGAISMVLLLLGVGCATKNLSETKTVSTEPIKIGWIGPLTGDGAAIGKGSLKAAEQAAAEINQGGGIGGQTIQLVAEDGKCNAKDAVNSINKLINIDQVSVIIGGGCSSETSAVAPIAEQNKKVLLSYCSSAPNITTAGDYIFRIYPSDAYQAKFGAEYIYNTLQKKKVAVLTMSGDYGKGIQETFVKTFQSLGGEIVFVEEYDSTSRDLRTQITKIKYLQPELVYFVGYAEQTLPFLKQGKELGLNMPFFGVDGWEDAKLFADSLSEGLNFTAANTGTGDTTWKDEFAKNTGEFPVCAPFTYDSFMIIKDIIHKVGTDSDKIKDELYQLKDYTGKSGVISLDKNGDLTSASYDVKIVKNGKAEKIQ